MPTEKVQQSKLNIIRSGSNEEEWIEEATLPKIYNCGIYAVAWAESGRVVSTGGNGAIVVYEERWDASIDSTIWPIIAQTEAANGVFEVNHITWAKRRIKS